MTRNLTWGLIGASDIAASRVIPAMRDRGDFIAAVVSADEERRRQFATKHDIPLSSANLDDAFADTVDAVYISNKNPLHHESALRAIQAGKHVLCEKPLALSLHDAEELVTMASEAGVTFAVNHHLPGSPLHAAARDLVSEGRIGQVLSARVHHAVELPERLRGWRVGNEPGSGVVLDITCHDASVLNPLLGRPVRVGAVGVRQAEWNKSGSIDAVMTVIEYEGVHGEKIIAQTHDAFTVGFDRTSLEIQGTEGSIRVLDAMTQQTEGTVFLRNADGEREIDVDTSEDLYSIVLNHFGAAIGSTGAPTASGADGLRALSVALAAEESIRTSTTVAVG